MAVLLTGLIDNCSMSFSLKNNLLALSKSDTIIKSEIINKNNDVKADVASFVVPTFLRILLNRNTSMAMKKAIKANVVMLVIILLDTLFSFLNNNLKSFARRLSIFNLHMFQ